VRDGGTDYVITHDGQPGSAAQRAWSTVQREHAARPYDLVIGFGCNQPGMIATTFATWLNVPSLISVRGNDFDRDWFDTRRHSIVAETLSRATVIAAVSPEKVDKIKALFPTRHVAWAPNGCADEIAALLPQEEQHVAELRAELGDGGRRIIGLFGELKYKKRIPLLLEAIRDALALDRVSLLVVGHLDGVSDAILADPALAPRWKHIPFGKAETMAPFYAACDFIGIPSLFEGFPNVLLEGALMGAIPLVSTAGAMGHVVQDGETGIVFEVEDRAAATDAVQRAVQLSERELQAMRVRVQASYRTRFSAANELAVLNELIKNAMEA
jgi:glycogen(starch) synthase